MKKTLAMVVIGTLLVGCNKDADKPEGTSASTPAANSGATPVATTPTAAAKETVQKPAEAQQPAFGENEEAKKALAAMLSEWQSGSWPENLVDVALLFQQGGVRSNLVAFQINGFQSSPKGTVNLTLEGGSIVQVKVLMTNNGGHWTGYVSR